MNCLKTDDVSQNLFFFEILSMLPSNDFFTDACISSAAIDVEYFSLINTLRIYEFLKVLLVSQSRHDFFPELFPNCPVMTFTRMLAFYLLEHFSFINCLKLHKSVMNLIAQSRHGFYQNLAFQSRLTSYDILQWHMQIPNIKRFWVIFCCIYIRKIHSFLFPAKAC